MQFDNDVVTLRSRTIAIGQVDSVWDEELGIYRTVYHPDIVVELSQQQSRRPTMDEPIAVLLARVLARPEIFAPPAGQAFCSNCGEWRPENYFVANASRRRGFDYECKQCKRERMNYYRHSQAESEGKVIRRYFKAA